MMKSAPKTPAGRRSRVLSVLLVMFILIGSWIAYFLVNFDLNDYRKYLEKELSALLSLPARIDNINYKFHETNLALRFSGLQLGDDSSWLQVNTPETVIDLQWRGLFAQEFRFIRVGLIRPEIWIRRSAAAVGSGKTPPTAPPLDLAIFDSASVGSLEVVDGTLHLAKVMPGAQQKQVRITGLQGELTEIRLNQLSRVTLEGDVALPGQTGTSSWQLLGEAGLQLDENRGLRAYTDLGLNVKKFDLNVLKLPLSDKIKSFHAAGSCDLSLRIQGTLGEVVDIRAGLLSDKAEIRPGTGYPTPIPFSNLFASGRLITGENLFRLEELTLKIDEALLAGEIEWSRARQQPFSAKISLVSSRLTVPHLKQWLPDFNQTWRTIRSNLKQQGVVQLEALDIEFRDGETAPGKWHLNKTKGEIQNVAWQPETFPTLEIKSLPFDLEQGRWRTSGCQLQMGSLDVAAHGHGEYGRDGFTVAALDFEGDALPERLFSDWYVPKGAWATKGKAAVSGHLQGPYDQLSLDLNVDFSRLYLNHPDGLRIKPGPQDKLTIHATLSPKKIKLDHGSINWSAAQGHITGSYMAGDPDSLELDALLSIDDLTRLAEALPLLEELQLRGQADLSISQRGWPTQNRPSMTLTLRDAGLRATRHIADLNLINGRINVTPDGLETENLSVRLGESPLTVKAELDDFTNPRLILDIRGATVRAQDVVFPADRVLLRELEGHLEIDRERLLFAPVDLRLDGGTDASVNGSVDFTPPYPVRLDITSDFALISEVIGLWARDPADREQPAATASASTAGRQTDIKITADIKTGDLYGMRFHDASGVIVPSRRRLMIHPLDFSVGDGYCNAQIITDFAGSGPARIRVSGHAEDVDALEVYRELLNQENIVHGALRGDFFLIGDIGSNFLSSSYGRFSIQVRDGVLRRFPILSKVFSLLNVSQIFALQLPDMDLEGMPFNTLSANFRLDSGILESDDLTIRSEAMNLSSTGQVDLVSKEVDLSLAIHPLGTVDKIVTRVPVAGWLLTGEDKALLTAHFSVTGKPDDVSVMIMPLDTLSEPTIGLLRRALGLPFKLLEDPQILWGGDPDEK